MCSIVSTHWCLSAACLRSSSSPFMFCTLSPTLSMSVHNVLSKHLGGLHRLPLRMVLTVANRASCAGVSVGIRKQCPRRRSLDCCMSIERGLDFVSLYNVSVHMRFGIDVESSCLPYLELIGFWSEMLDSLSVSWGCALVCHACQLCSTHLPVEYLVLSVQQTSSLLHSSQIPLLLPISLNLFSLFFSERRLILCVSLLARFLQQLSGFLFMLHSHLSLISWYPSPTVSLQDPPWPLQSVSYVCPLCVRSPIFFFAISWRTAPNSVQLHSLGDIRSW